MSRPIAWAPTIRPPPPRPWIARNAMSSTMEWLSPARIEPTRKITIAPWKKIFLPYWSPSLPHSGVDTVVASRYAVMTQAMCEPPRRSPTIVGSAVETMVWSSAARSMPSISAPMMNRTERRLRPGSAPLPSPAPLAFAGGAAPLAPAAAGEVPRAGELGKLIWWRPSLLRFCVPRDGLPGSGTPGQPAQRAVLGESVSQRLEGGGSELLQRHSSSGGGPERHGGPEAAHAHARQHRRIWIAVGVGAEPCSQGASEAGLDEGHVRGLRRPQLGIGVSGLHLPGPASRVAAKLGKLLREHASLIGQDHAQHVQRTAARQVTDQASTQFLCPARVRSEQHRFLGREIVEEGPRRDVRGRSDVLDRDVRQAPLGDEVESDPPDTATSSQLLPLPERHSWPPRAVCFSCDLHHAINITLQRCNVCSETIIASAAITSWRVPRWGPGGPPTQSGGVGGWRGCLNDRGPLSRLCVRSAGPVERVGARTSRS